MECRGVSECLFIKKMKFWFKSQFDFGSNCHIEATPRYGREWGSTSKELKNSPYLGRVENTSSTYLKVLSCSHPFICDLRDEHVTEDNSDRWVVHVFLTCENINNRHISSVPTSWKNGDEQFVYTITIGGTERPSFTNQQMNCVIGTASAEIGIWRCKVKSILWWIIRKKIRRTASNNVQIHVPPGGTVNHDKNSLNFVQSDVLDVLYNIYAILWLKSRWNCKKILKKAINYGCCMERVDSGLMDSENEYSVAGSSSIIWNCSVRSDQFNTQKYPKNPRTFWTTPLEPLEPFMARYLIGRRLEGTQNIHRSFELKFWELFVVVLSQLRIFRKTRVCFDLVCCSHSDRIGFGYSKIRRNRVHYSFSNTHSWSLFGFVHIRNRRKDIRNEMDPILLSSAESIEWPRSN